MGTRKNRLSEASFRNEKAEFLYTIQNIYCLCDFIPKCRSWRIVDAVKDNQNKNNKSKKKLKKIKDCRQAGIRIMFACVESKDHNHWTIVSYG